MRGDDKQPLLPAPAQGGRSRAGVRYECSRSAGDGRGDLDVVDVEAAALTGQIVRFQDDDPRGVRLTVLGTAADGETAVGIVGRYTETGRLLIITVYAVTE